MIRRRRVRKQDESSEEFVAINITPFTDVLLVLLIIFLIAGSSLTKSAIGIDRLSAGERVEESVGDKPQPVRALRLDAEGVLWLTVGGEPQERADIETLERDLDWELSADPETRMQSVVETYDQLLKSGVVRLTLAAPVGLP